CGAAPSNANKMAPLISVEEPFRRLTVAICIDPGSSTTRHDCRVSAKARQLCTATTACSVLGPEWVTRRGFPQPGPTEGRRISEVARSRLEFPSLLGIDRIPRGLDDP